MGELWALLHFLMPHLFRSALEFREWFAAPLAQQAKLQQGGAGASAGGGAGGGAGAGGLEGQGIGSGAAVSGVSGGAVVPRDRALVRRLHSVLRPFLLRRLKSEVAKQLPGKSEVVVVCPLSRRQRGLYEEFLQRASVRSVLLGKKNKKKKHARRRGGTARLLAGPGDVPTRGYAGMMWVLMQLRKVCNHPDLFLPRPVWGPLSPPRIAMEIPGVLRPRGMACVP